MSVTKDCAVNTPLSLIVTPDGLIFVAPVPSNLGTPFAAHEVKVVPIIYPLRQYCKLLEESLYRPFQYANLLIVGMYPLSVV